MNRNLKPVVLWLMAGVPIFIGTLQSIGALGIGPFGRQYLQNWPVIGPVAERVNRLEIFEQAGLEFFSADMNVYVIFFLITMAWLSFGASLVRAAPLASQQRKNVKIGAIALSGLLYALLFFVVYRGLFFLEVPLPQRLGFALIPFFVVGTLFGSLKTGSAVSGSWGTDLKEVLKSKQERFEREYERQIAPAVETAEELGVDRAELNDIRDDRNDVISRLEDLDKRIDDAREAVTTGKATVPEAEQIESDVQSFDTDDELAVIEGKLRETLRSFFDRRYSGFWEELQSPYGEIYGGKIVNVTPDRYTSMVLPVAAESHMDADSVYITNIGKIRTELLKQSVPVEDAVETLQKLEAHVYGEQGLIPHIETAEDEFEQADETIQSALRDAEAAIEQFGGDVRTALEELYIEGENETHSVAAIESGRTSAIASLHSCEFEDALDRIRTLEDRAVGLRDGLSDIELVVATAENDREYVELPALSRSGVPSVEDLERLNKAVRANTGNSYQIDKRNKQLTFEGVSTTEDGASSDQTTIREESNSRAPNHDQDGEDSISASELDVNVTHHLELLQQGASRGGNREYVEASGDRIVMQVGPIAEMFKKGPVYDRLDEFLAGHQDVQGHQVDIDGTEGHIEITPVEEMTQRQCAENLVASYKDQ